MSSKDAWECQRKELHYTWQQNQSSNGAASLNAKIWKELAENKGSTVWSERSVKLANCVAQNDARIGGLTNRGSNI
jgi:hypothetical protein